jgi:ABC-type uncharacterized transport system permease subunit
MTYATLVHIFLSMAAFSILIIAALQASLISILNYMLKANKFGSLLKLMPPLETMEVFLFRIILLGFAILSVSFLTAVLTLRDLFSSLNIQKILLSLLAWLLFAILLYGRYKSGWRGPVAIRCTGLGVCALFVAYFSSRIWIGHI